MHSESSDCCAHMQATMVDTAMSSGTEIDLLAEEWSSTLSPGSCQMKGEASYSVITSDQTDLSAAVARGPIPTGTPPQSLVL